MFEFIVHCRRIQGGKRLLTTVRRVGHKIVNIGDHTKCPLCSRIGRVVWISQDGKQAGVQCDGHHGQLSRGISRYGSAVRPLTKTQKNMVFLMDVETIVTIASTLE